MANVQTQLLLCGYVCSVRTLWTCVFTLATAWTDFADSKQFPGPTTLPN